MEVIMKTYGKELVLYMLLGDGYIDRKNLFILHSEKQKDYLEWKRNLLTANGINCNPIHYKNNNGFAAYYFLTSLNNAQFCTMRTMIYVKFFI